MGSSQKLIRAPQVIDVSEDLTPQLGGALDVNGKEITGAIDLHSTGDIIAELGDAAGSNKLSIRDSGGTEVAYIDSDGNISGTIVGSHAAVTLVTSSSPLDYLTLSGQELTLNQVDLTTDVTGSLPSGNIGSHNHTAADITDFDTEVSNNTEVAANTADRHVAATLVTTTSPLDYITLSGQEFTLNQVDLSTDVTGTSDDITEGSTNLFLTSAEQTKLSNLSGTNTGDVTLVTTASPLDYLTLSGQELTLNQVDLTSDVTGSLPVLNGGTGATTILGAQQALNLEPGVDIQAYDTELAALASTTSAADALPYFTGSGSATTTTLTSFARTLIDDIDAATARTTLGVDAAGTDNSTDITLVTSVSPLDYITLSGQELTLNQVDLSTDVSGDLPFANLTQATAADKLLGRGSAGGAGDFEEIALGSGLSMSGTTLSATASGGGDTFTWDFNTTTTDGDPGANTFRLNNATPAQVSEIYIDDLSTSGVDTGSIFDGLDRDDHIYIEDASGDAIVFRLVGKPSDNAGYWTIPVTHESGTTLFTASDTCFFRFLPTKNAETTRRTLFVPSSAMVPRTTLGATAATRELASNDVMVDVYQFADAATEGVGFWHNFGDGWDGGNVRVQYHWTVQSGSNNIRWGIQSKSIDDDEALDSPALGTAVYTIDTISIANDLHISALSSEVTVSGADPGEAVYFEVVRTGGDAGDTSTAVAELIGVTIEYNVTTSYNGNVNTVTFPAQSLVPRTTNGATAGSRELPSNDIILDYLEYAGTTNDQGAGLWLDLGNGWDEGSIRVKYHWTAEAGSGTVIWGVQSKSIDDDEALDSPALSTIEKVTDTILAVNDLHTTDYTAPITISGAGKGEPIYLEITRDITDGSADPAQLIAVTIEYTEALTPSMTTTEELAVAVSDETTAIVAATGVVTFRMPYAMVLKEVRANVNTAPSSNMTIDINITDEDASPDVYNTIMTTNKLTIDGGAKTSIGSTSPYSLTTTSIADDAEITIDIDADGSTAQGLKLWFIGYRA